MSAIAPGFGLIAPDGLDLRPVRLAGDERLNAPGEWTLEVHYAAALSLDGLLAKHLTVELGCDERRRSLDALCAELHQLPRSVRDDHARVILRPWLWWLTMASDNRIFQNMNTVDIVTSIFNKHGFSDYDVRLATRHEPREYCVQYGETDFAFVCRLLEEEGIFWFFTHEKGRHTLTLADSNDAFPPIPGEPVLPYCPQGVGRLELHGVRSAKLGRRVVPGAYRATDHAFLMPASSLFSQAEAEPGPRSIYEYPGGYATKARGDALGRIRLDALRACALCLTGESDCRCLLPGHWFTLTGHDDKEMNVDWVVTRVVQDLDQDQYRNVFEAIPRKLPYRPQRQTVRPRMHPQVASVVGGANETVHTDRYGRIRIHFPWDRQGKEDESCSCWVRVVVPWAGNGFGMQFVPRVGQEVIVSFIDGDPDRPLVTGCVYSADKLPPFPLPAETTRSGIRTRSPAGHSELSFDDQENEEQVRLLAQRNLMLEVGNDSEHRIGHDEKIVVRNSRQHVVEEGEDKLEIRQGDRSVELAKGGDTLHVGGRRCVKVEGDQEYVIGGSLLQKVDGRYELTVQGDLTVNVKGTLRLEGSGGIEAVSHGAVAITAATSLTAKAGTTLTSEAGTSLVSKAAQTQTIDGGAALTLKGGVLNLN